MNKKLYDEISKALADFEDEKLIDEMDDLYFLELFYNLLGKIESELGYEQSQSN